MSKKNLGWVLFWVVIVGGMLVLTILFPEQFNHGGHGDDHSEHDSSTTTPHGGVHDLDQEEVAEAIKKLRITVPDTTTMVTLKNGEASFTADQVQGFVVLDNILAIQHVGDGHDVFAKMAVNFGGSGTFTYIALFTGIDHTFQYAGAFSVGDRVRIESVDLGNVNGTTYTATVNYLDRKPEEPLAAEPTVKKSATATVVNHQFKK